VDAAGDSKRSDSSLGALLPCRITHAEQRDTVRLHKSWGSSTKPSQDTTKSLNTYFHTCAYRKLAALWLLLLLAADC
jgi:hypothetical protein